MRRLLSAAGLICRLNSAINSFSVMSGCCSILCVICSMVCWLTRGFRPWVLGLGFVDPVFLYSAQIFVTVLWLMISHLAMSVSFMLFCLCWIIFSRISFDVGLGNTKTASQYTPLVI